MVDFLSRLAPGARSERFTFLPSKCAELSPSSPNACTRTRENIGDFNVIFARSLEPDRRDSIEHLSALELIRPVRAEAPRARFDRIFKCVKTGYAALDRRLTRLFRDKAKHLPFARAAGNPTKLQRDQCDSRVYFMKRSAHTDEPAARANL